MKKSAFIFLSVFSTGIQSIFSYGSNLFGVPAYNDIFTASIIQFQDPAMPALPRSDATADNFISQVQSHLKTKYPAMILSNSQLKGSAATYAAWYGTFFSQEMVMLVSHGWYNSYWLYDNSTPTPNRSFGGWTRWVFLQTCLSLNSKNAWDYLSLFNGAHAVYGYESDYYQFIHPTCWYCTSYYRSEDWNKYFASYWVDNGTQMWFSYRDAVKKATYDNGGIGVAPAAVGLQGYVNGVWFVGWDEMVNTIYSGDVNAEGLTPVHNYQVFGVPTYGA